MICTIETKEDEEIKVIVIKKANGDIEAKATRGVTQEELENIIARLWTMLQPSKN